MRHDLAFWVMEVRYWQVGSQVLKSLKFVLDQAHICNFQKFYILSEYPKEILPLLTLQVGTDVKISNNPELITLEFAHETSCKENP